jgi:pimeloyl-ACP methyl ester carboxylesterase
MPSTLARRSGILLVATALALGVLAAPASALSSLADPPPGANDFSCHPSARHPRPVVLVHGLGATMGENWGSLSPLLAKRGYCVFALTYGVDRRAPMFGGVLPIETSARELGAFVDRVLAATGASQVDLVGHSEGTFMPQYWLKFLGGARKVDRYVAMTPLYAGTQLGGLPALRDLATPFGLAGPLVGLVSRVCGSCPEFLSGSAVVKQLSQGGAAAPGVRYTTIMTRNDELVRPYTSGYLDSPLATNIVLQHVCRHDLSEHAFVAFDPVVARLVFNALDPADARPVSCAGLPPAAPPPSDPTGTSASRAH